MSKSDSTNTTDLSGAPTLEEMDAMWLAQREEDLRRADLARYERIRRAAVAGISGDLEKAA